MTCVSRSLVALLLTLLTTGSLQAGFFDNWTHNGGMDAQFEAWLFDGAGFNLPGTQGDIHYFGSYDTPWSEPTIDLLLRFAVETPPPIVLGPPVGTVTSTWEPFIDRWPATMSLSLYNYDSATFDIAETVTYSGGTLGNSAHYEMSPHLIHAVDTAHVRDGKVRVAYDLVFRDDFDSQAYARQPAFSFQDGNALTGIPVPEPSAITLLIASFLTLMGYGLGARRKERAMN